MLFDSHCHISDDRYKDNKEQLISDIRRSEIGLLVDIGTGYEESLKAAESSRLYDFCYATAGFHPDCVADLSDEKMKYILDLYTREEKVLAIGEIGLDYHYQDGTPKELQQLWLRKQLEYAVFLGAPVTIHSREADEDTMRILKESGIFKNNRVLLHCFSSSAELAKQYIKLGAKISIAGPVTFKNNRRTIEVVSETDLSDLLIETDCPYLTPEPHRGETNYPFYVEFTARKIAEIKGISYEEVAAATFKNACDFYGLDYKLWMQDYQ